MSYEIKIPLFEGPFDLLLFFIERDELDIMDIPISEITNDFFEYISDLEKMNIEVASEFIVVAATLMRIKSRMLLPRPQEENEEEDPRAELIKRLQEYQRFKEAAERIDKIPRLDRETFAANAKLPEFTTDTPLIDIPLEDLTFALAEVMRRADQSQAHLINFEELSTRERMTQILERMKTESFIEFTSLFIAKEGKIGVVVTFLAILELLKDSLIEIVQSEEFGPIHIKGIDEVH